MLRPHMALGQEHHLWILLEVNMKLRLLNCASLWITLERVPFIFRLCLLAAALQLNDSKYVCQYREVLKCLFQMRYLYTRQGVEVWPQAKLECTHRHFKQCSVSTSDLSNQLLWASETLQMKCSLVGQFALLIGGFWKHGSGACEKGLGRNVLKYCFKTEA